MNKKLLQEQVQEFIRKNQKADLSKLILKGSPFKNVDIRDIAVQITGRGLAEKKLPTWYNTPGMLFPPRLNMEQTSSEVTAAYKAEIVAGKRLIDITGGFGIDTYYFSEKVEAIHYCELNKNLAEIAAHNFKVLAAGGITAKNEDGIAHLKETSHNFDWIYADPARRDARGGKVFKLSDCHPNIPANLELLFQKTDKILLKTSPLLDIQAGIKELLQVAEIHIVAVENEVKELLWILKMEPAGNIPVKTINIRKKGDQQFESTLDNEFDIAYSLPEKYLYEPNAAIMKSGCFAQLAKETETKKLHVNAHLFTSSERIKFPGRCFEVTEIMPFNRSDLKKKFKSQKANITTRNFPETVVEIRKKLKINDGGNTYLFFTTNLNEEKIVLVCKKLS